MSIGHNAGGIIPRGMDIDFQEAAKGSSEPFKVMMDWCEKTQSKAILGGTLTSQADGKSSTNALGNVHNEVRQELRDGDAKQIAATLTRDLIYPMYALNGRSFSGPHRIPRFEFDLSEPEDIETYARFIPAIVKMGVPVPVSWITDKLQIPEPQNGEPVLGQKAQPEKETQSEPEQTALAALKAGSVHSDQDDLDQALEELTKGNLSESLADMVAPLLSLAASAPDDLEAKLQALWPEMDSDALADRLAKIFFVAELWGMTHA